MKKLSGTSFDHCLETLEGRSLLSAVPIVPHAAAAAVVADAGFLNAASDPSGNVAADDSAMYDFGGAWGTQAAGEQVQQQIDLGGGAVDQSPGGPGPWMTPADVSTLVPFNYPQAAPYNTGATPIITANMDPVADDSPVADSPADAPIVSAPAAQAAAPQPSQPTQPEAMVVAAPSGPASIEWIEIPGASSKKAHDAAVAEQVVIASTFIAP